MEQKPEPPIIPQNVAAFLVRCAARAQRRIAREAAEQAAKQQEATNGSSDD